MVDGTISYQFLKKYATSFKPNCSSAELLEAFRQYLQKYPEDRWPLEFRGLSKGRFDIEFKSLANKYDVKKLYTALAMLDLFPMLKQIYFEF